MSIFAILGIMTDVIEVKPFVGPIPAVLKQISAATGSELRWAPDVGKEVVAISVPSAPRQEVLDQIAFALDAEWVIDNRVPFLRRSPETIQAQAVLHESRVADLVRTKFKDSGVGPELDAQAAASLATSIVAVEREIADKDEIGASYQVTAARMPSRRLLSLLVKCLNPLDIAKVQGGKRVVYSSKPNRMQIAFPSGASGAIARFRRESALLRAAWKESDTGVRHFTGPADLVAPKVILSVERPNSRYLRFDLEVIDEHLVRHETASDFVFIDYNRANGVSRDSTPVDRSIVDGSREPLTPLVWDGLLTMSRVTKSPVLMAIPDGLVVRASQWTAIPKPNLGQFRNFLSMAGVDDVSQNGWTIFQASDRHLCRMERLDRALLDQFLVASRDGSSLDAFANLATRHVPPLENTHLILLGRLGSWDTPITHPESEIGYARLYGTLSPAQRASVKLSYRDLTPPQRQIMSEFLLGRKVLSARPARAANPAVTITSETTELFPNGLASPFELIGHMDEQPGIFGRGERAGALRNVTPGSIAASLLTSERPDLFPPGKYLLFKSYAEGVARTWGVLIQLSPEVITSGSLSDNQMGPFGPIGNLSQASQDAIQKELARLREEFKNPKRSGGGGL